MATRQPDQQQDPAIFHPRHDEQTNPDQPTLTPDQVDAGNAPRKADDDNKPKFAGKRSYTVNWTLEHDGKTYEKGETVELTAEQVESLRGSKVISPKATADEKSAEAKRLQAEAEAERKQRQAAEEAERKRVR